MPQTEGFRCGRNGIRLNISKRKNVLNEWNIVFFLELYFEQVGGISDVC